MAKPNNKRKALNVRRVNELRIKQLLAKCTAKDSNSLSRFLANEELLNIEDKLFGNKSQVAIEPTLPPSRIKIGRIVGFLSLISFIVLFWYIIWRIIA